MEFKKSGIYYITNKRKETKMNIFNLAGQQLKREGKSRDLTSIIDRAIIIRKWLNTHTEKTANRIMAGSKVYQYGNIIKVRG